VTSGPAGLRVALASLIEIIGIWSLPIDANQGEAGGELQRLSQDAAAEFHPRPLQRRCANGASVRHDGQSGGLNQRPEQRGTARADLHPV
jgi:hypothetical protein